MNKLLLIYNPHAGKNQARSKLSAIIDTFTQAGALVTAYPTQGPGDAIRVARELAPGFDRVVACGGDGTLHEVITGFMDLPRDSRPPIGYIPAGTTNDFARNLSLPRGMEKMATLAAAGEPRAVDVGRLGERYFIYVAAFGAFTDVAYKTPQQSKNALGHLAYVLQGASELANVKSYHLTIDHDGGTLEGDYLYGMVCNTVSVGGLIGLPPDQVALDDGLLEAVLVKMPLSVPDFNAALRALATQEYSSESGVTVLHSSHFHITCEEAVPFTLDGEFGGTHTRAEMEAVPTPISIVYGG